MTQEATDKSTIEATLAPLTAGRATARFENGRASVVLDVTGLSTAARDEMEGDVKRTIAGLPGVAEVRVLMTSERRVRRMIAVASGKGGVGKSTVSANLAIALYRAGRKVGMVDADIYGPSQTRLLDVEGQRPKHKDEKLIPVESRHGVPLLSMGGLVEPGHAIAWRGPMAGSALGQLVDAEWGDKDLLVLDLPPGTGDVQLTMVQKHRPVGAVIVSTPQDLALMDARRAIDLFRKMNVPIIGLVENMSGYACPHCGEVSDPFGRGGAEKAAAELDIPFLGRIPLELAIRTASDAGEPPATGNGPEAEAFVEIAARVGGWLDNNGG